MTIEQLIARKKELGYTIDELSAISGVPSATIQKIFSGVTKSPRRKTILALTRSLEPASSESLPAAQAASSVYDSAQISPSSSVLKESSALYGSAAQQQCDDGAGSDGIVIGRKGPRKYTLEDYLALPEDQRVELIDGVFYDMAAPTTWHQAIGGFLYKLLLDHVLAHQGPCMPFMSPVDVQLDEDDLTVVQPDVLIVCDQSKYRNGRVFGAPDFVAEVLSPSTRAKDMKLKLYKYGNAGVREYWMIDPKKKAVIVYGLEHDDIPEIYTFEDTIPVKIWDGACRIDFGMIYRHIRFLFDL